MVEMIVPFQAIGNNVLIRPFLRTQTKGGVHLPESVSESEDLLRGEVVSIGPGSYVYGGSNFIRTTLNVGDVVFMSFRGRPSPVNIDGEKYIICQEDEITGIASKPSISNRSNGDVKA